MRVSVEGFIGDSRKDFEQSLDLMRSLVHRICKYTKSYSECPYVKEALTDKCEKCPIYEEFEK